MPTADQPSADAGAGQPDAADVSEPLRQLQHAEITVDQYLDYHAERAVEHLHGLISADQLEFIREMLREELTTDPILVELVRRVTAPASRPPPVE
jgi:hypothetical protein